MTISLNKTFLLALLCCVGAQAADVPRVHHRDGVLGTSFDMTLAGVDRGQQGAVVKATLEEIARLEGILSTWKSESDLTRVNTSLSPVKLSRDVGEVLGLCETWRRHTASAFSCRIGSLIREWRALEGTADLPDRGALRKSARALDRLDVAVSEAFTRPVTLQWDVDGIAKGFILDRALALTRQLAPQATGIRLDIGGDAVYWGESSAGTPWRVAVADPRSPRDNQGPIATVELRGTMGIASSGHRSRTIRVANRNLSQLIDPKEGWPAEYAPAATVVAKDAASADALATALSVLPIRAGLDLIERTPDAQALLVSETGKTFASAGWYALLAPDQRHDPPWPPGSELVVDYEIPQQDAVDYRRPYLAIWIADSAHRPLRQLLLLGESDRWMQEVRTWWRHAGREDRAAIDGIVRPTRRPGQYSVSWDGRDDQGRGVPDGSYLVCIEAAREHGEREFVELPVRVGRDDVTVKHRGAREIGRIEIRMVTAPSASRAAGKSRPPPT